MKYYNKHWDDTQVQIATPSDIQGSGCFPADTLVRTLHGYKPIQNITVNDTVVSYDRFGNLDYSLVSETFVHTKEETGDLLFFYTNSELIFPLGITANHAIYDVDTNEHKLAADFKIGDTIVSANTHYIIDDIHVIKNEDLPDDFKVYNLEVDPYHTYLVTENNIFVHNGGGGKGKGGGAKEAKNTLQSSAVVRVLEVISEGEIVGITNGLKGVKLNNTQVQNQDDTLNFDKVTFDQRYGLPSQSVIPGFSEVESTFEKGVEVKYTAPAAQTITAGVDAVKIVVLLPNGLFKTDTSNGNTNGHKVQYQIQTKPTSSGTWSTIIDNTLKGKTTSSYEVAHRVQRPAGVSDIQTWDVRLVRVSADETLSTKVSRTTFGRWIEIIEQSYTYDDTALVALTVPAESVGNQIPTRAYDVTGIKVQVPTNYDPVLRTYAGSWDGTFKIAWTDNPAWVLYDVITSSRYGINSFMNQPVYVDKWEFYNCAVYNDQLVPDGNGGTEVRYTFNAVIQTSQSAWQLLYAIASSFRSNLFMNGNNISLIQDRPTSANKIINNANVIDGIFQYSSSDANTRTTAVNVTYNDKNDNYLPRTISVENNKSGSANAVDYGNGIETWGYNTADLMAYGCVTESHAKRLARWTLYTSAKQTEMVSFTLALNSIDVKIGDVVKVMDNDYVTANGDYYTGRIESNTTNTVTLNAPVTIQSGHTYTIGINSLTNTSIIETTVSSAPGTYTTLNISQAITGDYSGKEFMIYSPGLVEPRQFKIINIIETEKGKYNYTGIFHDPSKFATIESGLVVDTPSYSTILTQQVPNPANIQFREVFYNDNIIKKNHIDVTFDWNTNNAYKDAVTFYCQYRRDDNEYQSLEPTSVKNFIIPDVTPGVYDVIIWAVSIGGMKSSNVFETYNYRTAIAASTLEAPIDFYVTNTTGTTFTGTHCPLKWHYNQNNDNKTDRLLDYVLEIWPADNTEVKSTHVIQPNATDKSGYFDYLIEMNRNDFTTPVRSFECKLYSRDTSGRLSTASVKTFTNPAPVLSVAPTLMSTFGAISFIVSRPSDADLVSYTYNQYETAVSTTPLKSFTSTSNTFDMQTDTGIYYYTVTPNDEFGAGTESARQSANALSTSVDTYTYTGLTFKPNDPSTNSVSWTSFVASKNGTTSTTVAAGSASYTSGILYLYYVDGNTTLQTTTNLLTAVSGRILATYKGGTDLTSDEGKAFISGDQLLAGSVGANQLVTNSAIITASAQIGDVLQSDNFGWPGNNGVYSGWRLDKTGTLRAVGIDLRNSSGLPIFQSGTGFTWNNVTGTNLPAANATKNTIYNQTTAPTGGTYSTGDLWVDTDAVPTTVAQWQGSSWVIVSTYTNNTNQLTDGAGLGTTATWANITGTGKPADNATKNSIYRQTTAPTGGTYTTGDLWVDTDSVPTTVAQWQGSSWVIVSSYTNNTNQITDGANLGGTAVWNGVTGTGKPADNATVNNVTYSSTAPTSPVNGDIWVDTSVNPNVAKVRVSNAWQVASNYTTNTNQLTDGAGLGTTATWANITGTGKPADNATKNAIYAQTTAPTGGTYTTGDLWVDTDAVPTTVAQWQGSSWVIVSSYTNNTNQLTDGANLGGTATWNGVTGTGKPADNATVNNVTYSSTAPTSPVNGDIWVDTSVNPNVAKIRVSNAWQVASNYTTNTNQLTDGAGLGTTATWANITGTGKPADGATKNTIYAQTTAPTGGTYSTGDLWVDTDAVPTTVAQWQGSSWVIVSSYTNNTNQITDGAGLGTKATWSGVTGTGKPADNATVNNVTYSSTAPTSPVNGDIWVDTTSSPYLAKIRVSGAWQTASNLTTNTNQLTDGANLGGTAIWTGITGTGKPDDNATKNIVTYSSTAPVSPVNGDIWVDTSVNPNVAKVRVSGAWQTASNYTTNTNQLTDGANLGGTATWAGVTGTNKPADNANNTYIDASGNLQGVSGGAGTAVKNSLITLNTLGAGTLATKNSVNWNVDLVNIPAFGGMAYISSITSANIGTYMGPTAISTAYIADAAITNAKIVDLNANKIINNTLIKSTEVYTPMGVPIASGVQTQLAILSRSLSHRDSGDTLLLLIQGNFDSSTTAGRYFSFQLDHVSSSALIYQWNAGAGIYLGYAAPERIIYNSTSDSTTRLMVGTACWPIMYRTDAVSNWQYTRQTDSSGNYIDIIVTGDYRLIMNYKHAAGANRTPSEITLSAQDIFK